MRRAVCWKRLLIVVVAAGALGGSVFAWHRYQVRSQAGILKEQAEKVAAEASKSPERRAEALQLMRKYLKFRPNDENAFRQYAAMLFDLVEAEPTPANFERVTKGLEEYLRLFPNNPDDRLKLAKLYIETPSVANLTAAKQHLEMLYRSLASHLHLQMEVLELLAVCERSLPGEMGLTKAIGYLEEAIRTNQAPVRVYRLAMEYHYANTADAQRLLRIEKDLLDALRRGRFQDDLEARITAARFTISLGHLEQAATDLDYAFTHLGGATHPDALLAKAEWELAHNDPKDLTPRLQAAEKWLRQAFQRDPTHVPVGLLLADVCHRLTNRAEAIQILKTTAEALDGPGDQLFVVIDQLIDLGEHDLSAALVERHLANRTTYTVIATYFRGRLAVLKQEWLTAQKLLNDIAQPIARVPQYYKRAMVGLAACYAAMQNPDRQLTYCREALRVDSGFVVALVGEAEALVRMGQLAEAVKKYRVLVHLLQLEAYRTELVRLELYNVLLQPPETRASAWEAFDASLGPAEKRTPEIVIYHADSLAARNKVAEAVQLLDTWLCDNPRHAKAGAVWVALARLKEGGRRESAWAVLQAAEQQLGPSVELRLGQAGVLAAAAKPVTADELAALATKIESFTPDERFRLFVGLGQIAGQLADRRPPGDADGQALRATALQFFRQAADVAPRDLACRAALLDQAIAAQRVDVIERVFEEMAAIEGPNGPVGTLGRLAVRLPEVRTMADETARRAAIQQLRGLAEAVREQRPGWSRVYVALGHLNELEGFNDAALLNYRQAIDKGERQEYVIRRTVELYRLKQEELKAVGLLDELSTEMRLPDDLERYRAIHRMLTDDLPQDSRATIDRIAPANSPDVQILLLRGALLAAIRHDDEALKAFSAAVEKADRRTDTWASLVAQLMKLRKFDEAKRAVAEAEKKLTVAMNTPAQRPELHIALGGLYEMIGDAATARQHFVAAQQAAPLELNPVRQLIQFLQRTGQSRPANELLNQAIRSPAPDIARWARRRLALTLLTGGDGYNQRTTAMQLIEQNLATNPNDPEDRKARAVILTVDPATRAEGVRILREFGDRGDLTPDEYFLLGQLAFDQGQLLEAVGSFRLAARLQPGVTAQHMAALVRVYLALDNLADAEAAWNRLKAQHPDSWEATREQARLLIRQSQRRGAELDRVGQQKLRDQALAVIQAFPGWDDTTNLATRSGPLLDELGFTAEAEAAFKKFLERDSTETAHVPLALFYIRHKQSEKAIALARQHEQRVGVALTAQLLTGAVRMKSPGPAIEAEIEKWLEDRLRDAAGQPELQAQLYAARAELFDAQRKYREALQEYDRCIATFQTIPHPQSRIDHAKNNRCMLLALHAPERAEEAVKMMTELIALRGPVPAYLDTRAVAYLVSSRPAEAKKDLQLALIQFDRATYRFHLAWAIDLDTVQENRLFAIDELKKAQQLGLSRDDLHPIEYQRYLELLAKYKLPVPR
ncbi:MAG: hypothetical protein RMJ56_17645 [Gemmataceae bacterium]|nr:hypothetical protein [Gemmata sp.]MDW8199422.1 hypothetical protein [Gemmataceae bacterium]